MNATAADPKTMLVDALERQGWDPWYSALLHAAMQETKDATRAIKVADRAFAEHPKDTSEPRDDDADAMFGGESDVALSSKDKSGHLHKDKGKGGGQFTSGGSSGPQTAIARQHAEAKADNAKPPISGTKPLMPDERERVRAEGMPAAPFITEGAPAGSIVGPRQDGESDKSYAKRVIDKLDVPTPLPEKHEKYFNMEKADGICRMDELVSAKTDEENKQGGANAPARMWAASTGLLANRDPITVRKVGDKYQVVDGNGTFTAAKAMGWKKMPVQLEKEQPPAATPKETKSVFTPEELALPKEAKQPIAPDAGYAALAEKGMEATHQLQQLLDLGKGVGSQLGYQTVMPKSEDELVELCKQPGGMVVLAPVKGEKRATEKVNSDYGGDWSKLIDIARASIVVDTFEDVEKTIDKLREHGTEFARQPKDRMTKRMPSGYRDVLTNVRLPNGIVGELQILCKPMMLAKVAGHKDYEVTRSIEGKMKETGRVDMTPEESAVHGKAMASMERLYDAAWEKCKPATEPTTPPAEAGRSPGARSSP